MKGSIQKRIGMNGKPADMVRAELPSDQRDELVVWVESDKAKVVATLNRPGT